MGGDKDSAASVRALVGLGGGLGLEVTAEGVETAEQQAMLLAEGCGQAQGFLYRRAMPAEEAYCFAIEGRQTKAKRRA